MGDAEQHVREHLHQAHSSDRESKLEILKNAEPSLMKTDGGRNQRSLRGLATMTPCSKLNRCRFWNVQRRFLAAAAAPAGFFTISRAATGDRLSHSTVTHACRTMIFKTDYRPSPVLHQSLLHGFGKSEIERGARDRVATLPRRCRPRGGRRRCDRTRV